MSKIKFRAHTAFCCNCRKEVSVILKEVQRESRIKGKMYSFRTPAAICQECGCEISLPGLKDLEAERLDQRYREAENIITKNELLLLLRKYNIGKNPLSLALGFGDVTVTRYLSGQMPSRRCSAVLKEALNNPEFMKKKLLENEKRIAPSAFRKAMEAAKELEISYNPEQPIELAAQYLLSRLSEITPLALQKLLYYAQGISSAIFKEPVFSDTCEAWVHGPVYPEIYRNYKKFGYNPIDDEIITYRPGLFNKLSGPDRQLLNLIADTFGRYSGKVLEQITHAEKPWQYARAGALLNEPSRQVIPLDFMREYFTDMHKCFDLSCRDGVLRYISFVEKSL